MLVTWMTLELTELSEGTMDWLPTGTRAISMVEPESSNSLEADHKQHWEIREDFKYDFADFVRKGGSPPPLY